MRFPEVARLQGMDRIHATIGRCPALTNDNATAMIMFGTAVTDSVTYDRTARKGIDRVRETDSVVLPHQSMGTLFKNYNLILDMAAERDDLEALVLLHQDAEIDDDGFCPTIRAALEDPEVAIVGCAGAIGVRSIAWWDGAVTWASFTHRYTEIGGGQFDSMSWNPDETPSFCHTGEVDSLDGFIMAFSPWAVRNLRFDETLGKLHGYDFDICCQAREAGKKVVTADFKMIHHHALELVNDPDAWVESYIRLAEKWEGRLPHLQPPTGDPLMRALRSEAESAQARASAITHQLRYMAMERHYLDLMAGKSWRLITAYRNLKQRITKLLGRGRKNEVRSVRSP
jgi:GT2 family glycosyltransferase